jgi:putative endonuclease
MQKHLREYFVYIVTNFSRTVLYTGVTNNLEQRVIEHYLNRTDTKTFAGRYKTYYLLHYECYDYILDAIAREKEIKGWSRKKKMDLIRLFNPTFEFLNRTVFASWPPKNAGHRKEN